jgi:hypothetical protein
LCSPWDMWSVIVLPAGVLSVPSGARIATFKPTMLALLMGMVANRSCSVGALHAVAVYIARNVLAEFLLPSLLPCPFIAPQFAAQSLSLVVEPGSAGIPLLGVTTAMVYATQHWV